MFDMRIINLPNGFASSSVSANATMAAMLPIAEWIIGVTVAFIILVLIIELIQWAANTVLRKARHAARFGDSSFMHRDSEATGEAVEEHRHYLGLVSKNNLNRISRYD